MKIIPEWRPNYLDWLDLQFPFILFQIQEFWSWILEDYLKERDATWKSTLIVDYLFKGLDRRKNKSAGCICCYLLGMTLVMLPLFSNYPWQAKFHYKISNLDHQLLAMCNPGLRQLWLPISEDIGHAQFSIQRDFQGWSYQFDNNQ
jgi:hypothetical protein